MAKFTTEAIRTLALVGHGACGKTTLTECLLAKAGVIAAPGSIERGTTVSDYDPLEKAHKHSIYSAVVHFEWEGRRIHLLDTPGAPDLITLRGANVLAQADIVFYDALVHPGTLQYAGRAEKVPVGKRCGGLATAQRFINKRLVDAARRHGVVVRHAGAPRRRADGHLLPDCSCVFLSRTLARSIGHR